jgi:hypothetical protein
MSSMIFRSMTTRRLSIWPCVWSGSIDVGLAHVPPEGQPRFRRFQDLLWVSYDQNRVRLIWRS